MKGTGRIQKSINNLFAGLINRMVTVILSFAIRTVFLTCLSNDYLSVNGLYNGILTMLSFAELGFGTAITYSMYKPLADRDYEKLKQLMRLYRKVYFAVGAVILVLGLSLIPFMDLIIKNKPDIEGLTFYYIVFLLNTVFSYWFFAYRTSIFNADQRALVVSHYQSIFVIIKTLLQIVALLLFRNYTLYLFIQIGCTIAQNIILSIKANKDYPIFRSRPKNELPMEEKRGIFKDTQALMLRKISFSILYSSDTLIISSMVGVQWVGLLSNYVLFDDTITGVLVQLNQAITPSLGNYFAKEGPEQGYRLFRCIEFMNYWLYYFCTIAMIVLINPLIELWVGKEYLLGLGIVIALATRFFTAGYTHTMNTFRNTLGLFVYGKYTPLITSIVNIVLSVLMSIWWDVAGVLFATSITRLCIDMWYTPFVICRYGFKKNVSYLFYDYTLRVLLLIAVAAGMLLLSRSVFSDGVTIPRFVMTAILTAILPNSLFVLAFHNRNEFLKLHTMARNLLKRS